jgi:hypothetical protein
MLPFKMGMEIIAMKTNELGDDEKSLKSRLFLSCARSLLVGWHRAGEISSIIMMMIMMMRF